MKLLTNKERAELSETRDNTGGALATLSEITMRIEGRIEGTEAGLSQIQSDVKAQGAHLSDTGARLSQQAEQIHRHTASAIETLSAASHSHAQDLSQQAQQIQHLLRHVRTATEAEASAKDLATLTSRTDEIYQDLERLGNQITRWQGAATDAAALETRVQLLEARLAAAEDRTTAATEQASIAQSKWEHAQFELAEIRRASQRALASIAELWQELAHRTH